jgi:Ser/Thr protein kinase RdoA (MazF antagonist)
MDIKNVINQYFIKSSNVSFEQLKNGEINLTYHLIAEENGEKKEYILQKMKPIFDLSIMEDIEFITEYLLSRKFPIQKVICALDGKKFIKDGASWWRLFTYIPGKIFNTMPSPQHAIEAGRLVGEFHNALADCNYKFKFKLPHYHDADFAMKRLRIVLEKEKNTEKYLQLKNLAENILTEYKDLPESVPLPKRIIHGDLKVSNILFDEAGEKALTFIDLDTLMHSTIAVEMGDALHFWSMQGGEDADVIDFDQNIYNAALEGYASAAKFLVAEEKNSITYGVKFITLSEAARYAIDAFEESYWVLNSSKYINLYEQNKKRAENQMKFFEKFTNGLQ